MIPSVLVLKASFLDRQRILVSAIAQGEPIEQDRRVFVRHRKFIVEAVRGLDAFSKRDRKRSPRVGETCELILRSVLRITIPDSILKTLPGRILQLI